MSLMDLSGVVDAFNTDVVSVKRPGADRYDTNGVAVAQTFTTTTDVGCSIQPGTGKKKVTMPEGVRPSDVITIYSGQFVFQPLDRIVITDGVFAIPFGGRLFEVFEVAEFTGLGNFSKAYARALAADEPRA